MIIELANGLKPASYNYKRTIDKVLAATVAPVPPSKEAARWGDATANQNEKFVRSSLPDDASEYHANYMTYLISGWSQHFPIVLNPDIVWFAVLNEIAKGVIAMPDEHRSLFTRSPDKIKLKFMVGSVDEPLPIEAVVRDLKALVPVDVNLFIPRFSTTTDIAHLSHLASFAETCTPYYSYGTFLCGYPSIRIDGTPDDYDLAVGRAVALYNEFARVGSPMAPWMAETMLPWLSNVADAVHKGDADYFKEILSTKRCGSGGEIEVNGWWSRLFRVQPNGLRKPDNFPTQIARVPWENIETNRKFTLNFGVFYSTKDVDGFVNPQFGWVQNELTGT